jgi:hypothetical protein
LTVSHLKCRDIIAHAGLRIPPEVKSELGGHLDPDFSVVDALDGFSLVLSQEGDVIHVSNNVTTFIGLSSFELLGNTFSEFVHPCDHEKLRLLHPQGAEQDAHVEVKKKTTFILGGFSVCGCVLCSCFLGGFSVVVCSLCSCFFGGFSVVVYSLFLFSCRILGASRIRDPVLFCLTSGSGMGEKSGSGIWGEHPRSFFRELRKSF